MGVQTGTGDSGNASVASLSSTLSRNTCVFASGVRNVHTGGQWSAKTTHSKNHAYTVLYSLAVYDFKKNSMMDNKKFPP